MEDNKINEKNTVEDNLKYLKSLFNVYLKVCKEINEKSIYIYKKNDVRQSTFQKCMICFRNTYISMRFSQDTKKIDFMFNNFITQVGDYSMSNENIIYEYRNCSKVSMQLMVFSCIESSLRPIYKTLELGEESDTFFDIYNAIINRFNMDEEYKVMFKILSKIRNTLHNNGVYVDKNQRDCEIEYRGYTYKFKHNNAIEDVWMSNLNELYRRVVVFLKDLFNEPDIKSIPFIGDRYATELIEINGVN